jgi:hypothetical protein
VAQPFWGEVVDYDERLKHAPISRAYLLFGVDSFSALRPSFYNQCKKIGNSYSAAARLLLSSEAAICDGQFIARCEKNPARSQ